MAKNKRADGAVRVGVVSDWKKPDNDRAPRRCKVGAEWVKVWAEKTTGWNDRKPIKSPNEALKLLGQAAIDGVEAEVWGYEELDDYGVTFYAEEVHIPPREHASNRYILANEQSGPTATADGNVWFDPTALHVLSIVTAEAAGVKLEDIKDFDAKLAMLQALSVSERAHAEEPAADADEASEPEVEF